VIVGKEYHNQTVSVGLEEAKHRHGNGISVISSHKIWAFAETVRNYLSTETASCRMGLTTSGNVNAKCQQTSIVRTWIEHFYSDV